MLIVCPSCATSYDVELASLGPLGRQVRCSRCRTVWRAAPAHADKLLAAAEAIAPAPVAEPVLEDAGAAPPHEPAVEAPTEEVSELRRRIAAMDEPEGEEEAAEGEAIDAPAAEGEAPLLLHLVRIVNQVGRLGAVFQRHLHETNRIR